MKSKLSSAHPERGDIISRPKRIEKYLLPLYDILCSVGEYSGGAMEVRCEINDKPRIIEIKFEGERYFIKRISYEKGKSNFQFSEKLTQLIVSKISLFFYSWKDRKETGYVLGDLVTSNGETKMKYFTHDKIQGVYRAAYSIGVANKYSNFEAAKDALKDVTGMIDPHVYKYRLTEGRYSIVPGP